MILGIFPRGSALRILPSAWRKARDLLSSSDNLLVDVMMWAIPTYCPICALLNKFYSLLSTSTSISLRLNSSVLLLSLETFNKEEIFIKFRAPGRSSLVRRRAWIDIIGAFEIKRQHWRVYKIKCDYFHSLTQSRGTLSILRNMHQFFTYKSSVGSVLQIIQDTIAWFLYNSI